MPDPIVDFEDPVAIEKLWREFYPRLKAMISSRVRSIKSPVADESEIALSAINSFVNLGKSGQFEDLSQQDGMWRLLKTIAIRKVQDSRRRLWALKRGGADVTIGQSELADGFNEIQGVESKSDFRNGPTFDVEVADLFSALFLRLPDDRHRDVVLLKLQGASVAIIAECLNTTTRTVQRLLKKIESDWQVALLDADS